MRCAVYEHIVFEGHKHQSIRSLPGMAERTLRIGSAGKTFSFTAWKVRPWKLNPAGEIRVGLYALILTASYLDIFFILPPPPIGR